VKCNVRVPTDLESQGFGKVRESGKRHGISVEVRENIRQLSV